MNGIAWNESLYYIKKYVVKIETPTVYGTGFFVTTSKVGDVPFIYFATAYHLVRHANDWLEPIKITHGDKSVRLNPNHGNGYRIEAFPDNDLAIIGFPLSLFNISEPPIIITHPTILFAGIEIGWCGFPSIVSNTLCFFNGHISAQCNPQGDYYVDGTAIQGTSGGPVFIKPNGETILIGVVSDYVSNQQVGPSTPGLRSHFIITHT